MGKQVNKMDKSTPHFLLNEQFLAMIMHLVITIPFLSILLGSPNEWVLVAWLVPLLIVIYQRTLDEKRSLFLYHHSQQATIWALFQVLFLVCFTLLNGYAVLTTGTIELTTSFGQETGTDLPFTQLISQVIHLLFVGGIVSIIFASVVVSIRAFQGEKAAYPFANKFLSRLSSTLYTP